MSMNVQLRQSSCICRNWSLLLYFRNHVLLLKTNGTPIRKFLGNGSSTVFITNSICTKNIKRATPYKKQKYLMKWNTWTRNWRKSWHEPNNITTFVDFEISFLNCWNFWILISYRKSHVDLSIIPQLPRIISGKIKIFIKKVCLFEAVHVVMHI